jgi:hypothetical protein
LRHMDEPSASMCAINLSVNRLRAQEFPALRTEVNRHSAYIGSYVHEEHSDQPDVNEATEGGEDCH